MGTQRLETPPAARAGVERSLRALRWWLIVGIAAAITPLNLYWLVQIEQVRWAGYPTTVSLFYNVVFWMLLILLANWPFRRLLPEKALSHGELVAIYVLLSISTASGSLDMAQDLVPIIGFPHHFATPENGWRDLFFQYLPDWLVVSGDASDAFWEGKRSITEPALYGPWIGPVAWWTAFTTALFVMCLGVNLVFRRRWIASERLTFPVMQLPLEMTDPSTPLFRDRLMWLGFGAATFVELMNGLHHLKPIIPAIPTKVLAIPQFNIGAQLIDRPWNAIGFAPVSFYPFVIGMGLLLPVELSFSCWAFFWFFKAERVVSVARGMAVPGAPWILEQSFGGFLGLSLFALWIGRTYLWRTVRSALFGEPIADDASPSSYRLAYLMILSGLGFLVWFSMRAGASFAYALAFFVIYIGLSLAVTRIRAEMGLPVHDLHFSGPEKNLERIFGSRALGHGNEMVGALYYWFNRAYRSHSMPHAAEAFKLFDATRSRPTGLWPSMVVATIVGMVLSCAAQLMFCFRLGAGGGLPAGQVPYWIGNEPWRDLTTGMTNPTGFSIHSTLAVTGGIAFAFLAMFLKTRLLWWPIHPAGFAVSSSWAMERLWCPLFIAWAVKSALIRYGGAALYVRAIPLAFGLILGDFTMGSLWNIYGVVKNVSSYSFWD